MNIQEMLMDLGVGLVGGFVGTKVMEPVQMTLYEWEPEQARKHEERVRPGPPFQIAAQKMSEGLGLNLHDSQRQTLGMALHYGLGMAWGPVYTLVARRSGTHPLLAGLLTGAAMSILADEFMTPAMGASAPNREYPLVTHLRGFVGHLVFGVSVAATAELLYRLGRLAADWRGRSYSGTERAA